MRACEFTNRSKINAATPVLERETNSAQLFFPCTHAPPLPRTGVSTAVVGQGSAVTVMVSHAIKDRNPELTEEYKVCKQQLAVKEYLATSQDPSACNSRANSCGAQVNVS